MIFHNRKRASVSIFALAFVVTFLFASGLLSLKSGLLRNVADRFLFGGGDSVSLQNRILDAVNMRCESSGEEEEPELGPLGSVWIKEGHTASSFFFDLEGIHASRVTVEFSEPLEETVYLAVGVQHKEAEEYDWTVSWEQCLSQGSTYALFRVKGADQAKRMCISFDGDGYVRLPVSDVVVNGSSWHIWEGICAMPWTFILLVSLASACLVTMCLTRRVKKHCLPFALVTSFLLGLILYQKYICGDVSLLYSTWDGFSQYLPSYINYSHLLREYGYLPRWSFSVGFGAMMSYDVLLYPLNLVPVVAGVLFGDPALEMSFVWLQIGKIVLATLFMFLFLRELGRKPFVCLCMSILYAFCGIMILRGNWIFLADEVYLAAMLLWAVERYFRRGQWAWIPPVIYLIGTCMGIFYLYLYALLLIVYATTRFVYAHGKLKDFPAFILKCGLLFFIGAMLWSVILIGFSWSLFQTVRFGDTVNYFDLSRIFERVNWDVLLTTILRTYSTDTLGVFDQYSGYSNYLEGPLFYCGTLCLFLMPQAIKGANKRQRRLILFGLFLVALYLVFPFVTDVTCAFIRNEENGLRSYRISSEWICVLMVVISSFGLDQALEQKKFNTKTIAVTGIALFSVLGFSLLFLPEYGYVADLRVVRSIVFFLICWLVILSYFHSKKQWRGLLCAMVILEAFAVNRVTINKSYDTAANYHREMQKDDLGYYSSISKIVAELREEDPGLYRIGGVRPKTGGARYCAAQYFDLFDSNYYTSIDRNNYEVLHALYPDAFDTGLGSKNSIGVADSEYISALTGYKYYLVCPEYSPDKIPKCYRYMKTVDNIDIYVNPDAYSIGTTFDHWISTEAFMDRSMKLRQKIALECIVMDDEGSGWIEEATDQVKAARKGFGDHRSLKIDQWKPDRISGSVETTENTIMLFTIPNTKGWRVYVDGERAEILPMDFGFFGVRLTPGDHAIVLRYKVDSFALGLIASLVSLAVYLLMLWLARRANWLRPFPRKKKRTKAEPKQAVFQNVVDAVQPDEAERDVPRGGTDTVQREEAEQAVPQDGADATQKERTE